MRVLSSAGDFFAKKFARFRARAVEWIRTLLENAPFCSPLDLNSLGDRIITSICLATRRAHRHAGIAQSLAVRANRVSI